MANFYVSSGTSFSATINITYPSGSTCTVTNYKKTWTAPNTTGSWTFKANEVGYYTVKAVNGSESEEKEVLITAERQSVSIELSYGMLLYKSGKGAIVQFETAKESNASIQITSDAITTNFTSDINYQITCITPKIDLTEFSRLSVIANCTGVGSETAYKGILGVFAKTATATNLVSAKNSDAKVIAKTYFTVKNGEFDLNITNINGEYKVGIKGGLKSTISEIRLRR